MTLSTMTFLRIAWLISVALVFTVPPAAAQETFVNFDFEDQAATSLPENGALTNLSISKSGVTVDIARPPAGRFDVLANVGGMPSAWGSRSLDPFVQPTGPAFIVNSSAPSTGIQVMMGDFGGDADVLTLQAFSGSNATGTLLATNSKSLPAGGSTFNHVTFGVQAPGINSFSIIGGSPGNPNSVLYDNVLLKFGTADPARTFSEVGDAGSLTGTAHLTTGSGQLTTIKGSLGPGDQADMFKIFVEGGRTFSATTSGGVPFDSTLALFDSTGRGVYLQDDFSGFQAPSTLPAGHPLTPLAPGLYYLLIEQCCLNALSSGGPIFPELTDATHEAIHGPTGPGGGQSLTGFSGSSDESPGGGAYTITLTGAQFAVQQEAVPEPSTLLLLASGLVVVRRALRKRARPW